MRQQDPNSFNSINKSCSAYKKGQLLIDSVKSQGRTKIDKICHFSLFSKILKIQTQVTSLKLPT